MNRVFIFLCVAVSAFWVFGWPKTAEIQISQPLVAELMAGTIAEVNAKMKTPIEAADVSLRFAAVAENEAIKYLLLRGAVLLYAKGGAYDQAADAVVRLQKEINGIPTETLAEMLASALVGVSSEKAPRLYAQYGNAKRVIDAKKEIVKIGPNLRASPSDQQLRRRFAECYAMADDWPTALKHFSRLGKDFAAIVAFEKDDEPTETVNALTVADFWWSYPASDTVPFKAHAAIWYHKAMEADLVKGLRRELVVKRLDEAEILLGGKPKKREGAYCVIDLSAGSNATVYPVTFTDTPPVGGFNTKEYKTTKLVLRRVEPGTFIMGENQTDVSQRVTLTKPFYIGVFELTQKQWSLVMGGNPSNYRGDTYPVEAVSWNTIRGDSSVHNWPTVKTVDADTFIGRLRKRTRLGADLPTHAQWEYACRAGTTSKFNNGGNSEDDLKKLGRYDANCHDGREGPIRIWVPKSGIHAPVGMYEPNAWGLYDMHGNVHEWCLDWDGITPGIATDPEGPSSGQRRGICGGGCWLPARRCTSASMWGMSPESSDGNRGFRLVIK